MAEISGNDGNAAVKSDGESIDIDLDGTNKAVINVSYAFDDMTVGEKANFIPPVSYKEIKKIEYTRNAFIKKKLCR